MTKKRKVVPEIDLEREFKTLFTLQFKSAESSNEMFAYIREKRKFEENNKNHLIKTQLVKRIKRRFARYKLSFKQLEHVIVRVGEYGVVNVYFSSKYKGNKMFRDADGNLREHGHAAFFMGRLRYLRTETDDVIVQQYGNLPPNDLKRPA